ncbi:MAG: hypothetical protein ACJ8ER_13290 [Allosphingosinicella sp.]
MHKAAVAAVVAAFFAAGAAPAQLATGRSGSSTMSYLGQEEVWREIGFFGLCYADQNRDEALQLIATAPGSREEALTYKKLFSKPYQSCLGDVSTLAVPLNMVRGSIAEGLLKKHVPIPASLLLAAPAPGAITTISEAARCYAVGHRTEVRGLLDTIPGSKKEFAALVPMVSEFTRCVPPKARGLAFDPTQIRFRLAEALLRLPPAPEKN